MINKAQEFWDKQAKRFDDSQKQLDPASQDLIARTKEYLNADDNVLDFGCATGIKTIEMAEAVSHIHGLDFSSGMISEARKNKDEVNARNVSFSQGTIFNDDLKKASFDKIIAYSIIHLLEDCEDVIHRIHDLLRPGGLLISETACFKDKMDFKTRLEVTSLHFMRRIGIFPLHLNLFKAYDVEQLIIRQNFNILQAQKLFYNGMTISFIVAEKQEPLKQ